MSLGTHTPFTSSFNRTESQIAPSDTRGRLLFDTAVNDRSSVHIAVMDDVQ
jgi:hypothetical protein